MPGVWSTSTTVTRPRDVINQTVEPLNHCLAAWVGRPAGQRGRYRGDRRVRCDKQAIEKVSKGTGWVCNDHAKNTMIIVTRMITVALNVMLFSRPSQAKGGGMYPLGGLSSRFCCSCLTTRLANSVPTVAGTVVVLCSMPP